MIVTMMQLRGIMPIIPVRITLPVQHNNRPAETSMWCDDKPLSFKEGLTMNASNIGLVDVCDLKAA